MMLPPDPLRQRMLFKTELRAIAAHGEFASRAADSMNTAFATLASEGFSVQQILPMDGGFLVIGQRAVPLADTPMGSPIKGTEARQEIEVVYGFRAPDGIKELRLPTLREAVLRAVEDLEGDERQPISIHVTSITTYRTGDIAALYEKFR